MADAVFQAKYVVETALRGFLRKDLHPGKWQMYRICMPVYDDTLDTIYFYVPQSDVEFKDENICTVLLTQKEYDVYYCSKDEDIELVREPVNRFVIADAYYQAYPVRKWCLFDLLCVPRKIIYESDDSFTLTFLSTSIAANTPIRFSVPKENLYWVYNEEGPTEYAHVKLKNRVYGVTYKNKKTHWKERTIDVMSDEIAVDFLNNKRAAFSSVSSKIYCNYLLQEQDCSRLFKI